MPVREPTGALTFRLDSRWYWCCVILGLAVYASVDVLLVVFAVQNSAELWPGLLAVVLAATAMVGVARLLAWQLRRLVIDGGMVTVVTVIDERVFPISGITRISVAPRRILRASAKLWLERGAVALHRVPFAPDRPADVMQALIQLRPDVPVSSSWSAPVPLPAPRPAPPQHTQDGRWWWNEHEWLPVPSPRPPAVRRHRWGLVAGASVLAYLAAALAIWAILWIADAGDRHLAANAVATTAHVTMDAARYGEHGEFCYSYLVGEQTYRAYSACGYDLHPDAAGNHAPIGAPLRIIYDRQHPDVSCVCTTDYLTHDQPGSEVMWAIGLASLLALAVLVYVVVDVVRGYRSRRLYALAGWLR